MRPGHARMATKLFGLSSPTCRTILAESYGVTQVRLGIERFLAGAAGEVEAGPSERGS